MNVKPVRNKLDYHKAMARLRAAFAAKKETEEGDQV